MTQAIPGPLLAGRAKAAPLRRPLPVDRWPEHERAAWLRSLAPGLTPLDRPGKGAHLSTASQHIYKYAFGSYLSWLQANSALAPDAPLADRASPVLVGTWMSQLRLQVGPRTVRLMLEGLIRVLDLVEPHADWKRLRRLPQRPTLAEQRAGRRPLPSLPDGADLISKALALCESLRQHPPTHRSALAFRSALLVAFATLHPFRRRSLAEIEVGRDLEQVAPGIWRLQVSNTKLRTGFNVRVADALIPSLEHYISVARPFLMAGEPHRHARLWVGPKGAPLGCDTLHYVFGSMVERLMGERLNIHGVRHMAATTLLDSDPRCLALVTAVLGNRSALSVNSTYDRSSREASLAIWREVRKKARRGGLR